MELALPEEERCHLGSLVSLVREAVAGQQVQHFRLLCQAERVQEEDYRYPGRLDQLLVVMREELEGCRQHLEKLSVSREGRQQVDWVEDCRCRWVSWEGSLLRPVNLDSQGWQDCLDSQGWLDCLDSRGFQVRRVGSRPHWAQWKEALREVEEGLERCPLLASLEMPEVCQYSDFPEGFQHWADQGGLRDSADPEEEDLPAKERDSG